MEPTLHGAAICLFDIFGPRLGVTEDENDPRLPRGGRRSTRLRCKDVRGMEGARHPGELAVEAEDRVAILLIGRPYHSDPGLNHGIPEEFQVLRLSDL